MPNRILQKQIASCSYTYIFKLLKCSVKKYDIWSLERQLSRLVILVKIISDTGSEATSWTEEKIVQMTFK